MEAGYGYALKASCSLILQALLSVVQSLSTVA
jgi:hypothetical protein